jgi:hypothetical protein
VQVTATYGSVGHPQDDVTLGTYSTRRTASHAIMVCVRRDSRREHPWRLMTRAFEAFF